MNRNIAALAISIALGTCPAFAKTMTADEIQNELIGKVLCAKRQAGGSVCVKHNPGGKSAVISGAEKQTGAWRFEGNQHCTRWQKIRGGKEFCSTFEKDGSAYSNSGSGPITVK